MVGIPIGTNCVPLLADLFLYSYENEFLDKLIEGKRKLARKFNLSYRYTDDPISFNNKKFKEFISDIYPKELTTSETTESTSVAYLDLLFTRDKSNNITTKLYDTNPPPPKSFTRTKKSSAFRVNKSAKVKCQISIWYNACH